MSDSSPTTRTVPLATAVVNGDSRGSKERRYGSSDVSWNRIDISALSRSVSSSRPEPETERRGDAASKSAVSSVAAQRQPARDLTDAFVAHEQIVDARLHVVARLVEVAGAGRIELQQAGQRRARKRRGLQRLDRDTPPVDVERIGPVPADPRRAGGLAGRLGDLNRVEPHAGALEAERGRHRLEGLAVRDAVLDQQAPEAERGLVVAVDVVLA